MTGVRTHPQGEDTQPYERPPSTERPSGGAKPTTGIPRWVLVAAAVLLGFVAGAVLLTGGDDESASTSPPTVVPVERIPETTVPAAPATSPSTAISSASSTTPTTVVPIATVDLGGFEEGSPAPAGRWIAHQPGAEIGPWLVGVTVVRDRAEIHNPNLTGHVLNLRTNGSVSRIVDGLQPGYRYRLELDAARHNLVALGSASARLVVGEAEVAIEPSALSGQSFDRLAVEFVPEHRTVGVQITGTGSSLPCCGVVIDNLVVVPVADADGNPLDPDGAPAGDQANQADPDGDGAPQP
ncbi:MAG: hypothetical protein AAFN30_01425 [Actinomycetota bacterium]